MIGLVPGDLLVRQRAGEVLLMLGLSLWAALLLRALRKALSSGRFGARMASWVGLLAAVPGAGALLCFYSWDRFYDDVAIRRPAAILGVVLSGMTAGVIAEARRARTEEAEDEDPAR